MTNGKPRRTNPWGRPLNERGLPLSLVKGSVAESDSEAWQEPQRASPWQEPQRASPWRPQNAYAHREQLQAREAWSAAERSERDIKSEIASHYRRSHVGATAEEASSYVEEISKRLAEEVIAAGLSRERHLSLLREHRDYVARQPDGSFEKMTTYTTPDGSRASFLRGVRVNEDGSPRQAVELRELGRIERGQ